MSQLFGGDIPISAWKVVKIEDLVQKVPKLAKNRDFQVLAVRNTDFWRTDETPYILDG